MAGILDSQCAIVVKPGTGSFDPQISFSLVDKLNIDQAFTTSFTLDVDTEVTVDLCGLTEADVLAIRVSRNVTARITTAVGTAQIIPFSSSYLQVSTTNPVTALTLTRDAGQSTEVSVLMAQLPS